MYGIYTKIGGILMVNVTMYSIHGSYAIQFVMVLLSCFHLYVRVPDIPRSYLDGLLTVSG